MGDVFMYNRVIKPKDYDDYLSQCEGKVHLVNIGAETFYSGTTIDYCIYDVQTAKEVAEKTTDANLVAICDIFIKNYGKKMLCASDSVGELIGLNLTHEDYYYILIDEDGNTWYESCVGKIKEI